MNASALYIHIYMFISICAIYPQAKHTGRADTHLCIVACFVHGCFLEHKLICMHFFIYVTNMYVCMYIHVWRSLEMHWQMLIGKVYVSAGPRRIHFYPYVHIYDVYLYRANWRRIPISFFLLFFFFVQQLKLFIA